MAGSLRLSGCFERFRRRWQNPEAILGRIGVKSGLTFMDIGCGEGFFTLPVARMIGENGKVYGLDIDGDAIAALRERARRENLANLTLKVGKAEETIFCEGCADIVFYANVLHDFEDPNKVLANARKMIKLSGKLIDLDWKKKANITMPGPPLRIRLSEKEASNLIEAARFKVEATEKAGPYHYLITAKPTDQPTYLPNQTADCSPQRG